ncbi:SRPBCC family protein [Tsukamurella strandjordii]|uniref:ATPase n=1 Tax=Tsukamurella strandjordii TaxID=147577 RepID=A0AA90N8K5_9ACTN|nr:SRPBCC family protein [Tsukamurella strandjordii]MDP0397697.1 ATPase [Tsukamurella strandjordii]
MERFVASRTIPSGPGQVFAVLTDPDRHQYTEPGSWVRGAVDATPIDHVDQMFSVNMYLEQAGGDYVMENKVTDFEPDRTIGWLPGTTQDGRWQPGGWWWRYDLAPSGEGTEVTLTYDWTDTPQAFRDQIGGMPPFPPEFLDESLAALDRHLQS